MTLSIEGLTVALPPGADRAAAVENVSLTVSAGEIVCVVGESGSGKSVTAGAVMGLLPPGLRARGVIRFEGQDLLRATPAQMRAVRGARIGMVFQEPMTALNPLMRVGEQIAEVLRVHGQAPGFGQLAGRVAPMLEAVGLPEPERMLRAYPHTLSGGQRQRVVIAMALALEPAILIADEPTTALDVTTQMQVLQLIRSIQRRRGMGVLFITHDFGVVAEIADRVAVMRQGVVVEQGLAADVLARPQHPYTQALLAAVPAASRTPRPTVTAPVLLRLQDVGRSYGNRVAVDGVSLEVRRGETLGVVGESGSGKSTLARCVVNLVTPDRGSIVYDGTELVGLSRAGWAPLRRRIGMVFQDPFASLNPRRRVGDIVAEGLRAHRVPDRDRRVAALLALVQLDPGAAQRFPHEFSGGQRQRIGIARALALEPELLVADEPVSALDVSVQAGILALLERLRTELGLAMLFITHDLRVAAQVCDRVAVMQAGRVVETGPVQDVFARPQHAYTRALLASVPGRGLTVA